MTNNGEKIKELATKLERNIIIEDLKQINNMEELNDYIEFLESKIK